MSFLNDNFVAFQLVQRFGFANTCNAITFSGIPSADSLTIGQQVIFSFQLIFRFLFPFFVFRFRRSDAGTCSQCPPSSVRLRLDTENFIKCKIWISVLIKYLSIRISIGTRDKQKTSVSLWCRQAPTVWWGTYPVLCVPCPYCFAKAENFDIILFHIPFFDINKSFLGLKLDQASIGLLKKYLIPLEKV